MGKARGLRRRLSTTGISRSRRLGFRALRWGMSKAMTLWPSRKDAPSASRSNRSRSLPLGRSDIERDASVSGRKAAALRRVPSSTETSRSRDRQRRRGGWGIWRILGCSWFFDGSCKALGPRDAGCPLGNLREYTTRVSAEFSVRRMSLRATGRQLDVAGRIRKVSIQ